MERQSAMYEAKCEQQAHEFISATNPGLYNSRALFDSLSSSAEVEIAKRRCMRSAGFTRPHGRDR